MYDKNSDEQEILNPINIKQADLEIKTDLKEIDLNELSSPDINLLYTSQLPLEKRRWIILTIFSFFTYKNYENQSYIIRFSNAASWLTYSSILDQSEKYYSKEKNDIVWFGNVYFIIYIALSYFGSYLIFKYFKWSMLSGTGLNAIGCWLRYIAKTNYNIALVGQICCALSQIWVLETPVVIGENWFPKKEKFLAVSIAIFSNFLGNGISYIFSASLSDNIPLLLMISAIVSSIPFVLCVLFIKEKPDHEPNFTANLVKDSFFNSMKKLIKNYHYLLAMFCFSFCLGHIWTLATLIDLLLDHQNLSTISLGECGLFMILSGMFGGILASVFLEKFQNSRKYIDLIIKILISIAMGSMIILTIFIKSNIFIVATFLCFTGFGLLAVIPFLCESLMETSFPVHESLSINTLFLTANIVGEIITLIITPDSMAEYRMMILTVIFAFPFLYTIFLFKTQFNKTKEAVKSMRRSTNSFNFEEGKNLQKTKNDSQNDFVIA